MSKIQNLPVAASQPGCNTEGVENASEVVPPQVTGVAVTVDWTNASDVEPKHINQVLSQLGNPGLDGEPDGIYVALGTVAPPVVGGGDEESRLEALEALGGSISVTVHGRYHMNRGFLDALIRVLQTTADQYDAVVRQAEAAESPGSEVGR